MNSPVAEQTCCFARVFFLLALIACILQVVLPMSAADTQFNSRQWQAEDGLPNNSVQAITQTSDGYLWIGTTDGLARFDGIKFTSLDLDAALGPKTGPRSITSLLEDTEKTLWIGTERNGLLVLKDGKVSRPAESREVANGSIRALFQSRDGTVWAGKTNGMLHLKNKTWELVSTFAESLPDSIREIQEDSHGKLWLATSKGVKRWPGETGTDAATVPSLKKAVRAFRIAHDDSFWIGTLSGLYQWKDGNTLHFTKSDGLQDNVVSALYEDLSHTVWVGTYGGLHRMIDGKPKAEFGTARENFGQVNAIYEDREGSMWIGTRDGLHRLNAQRFSTYSKAQGLTHENVMSICEDRTGGIWMGTWGGGLNKLKYGAMSSYTAQHGLASDMILGICEAHNGSIWIGTDFENGLFHLYNGQFDHYGREDGLIDPAVRVVYEDQKTNLWIGTRTALYIFNRKFTRFTTNEGLAGNSIRTILEDHAGTVWIGTESGLSCYRDGQFMSFKKPNGLSHETILALHEDSDGVLWIGTGGGGLNRFENGSFRSYTATQGLFRDEIFSILEDKHGWLWMSCSSGIFRVSKQNLADFDAHKTSVLNCVSYGKSDGLISAQCNGVAVPSAWKTKDGRLWFCTIHGVAVVDPELELKPNDLPPPVFIEEVFADGHSATVSSSSRQGATSNFKPETLNLPPGRGELEFTYTALSFQAPEKNRFKYRLEGADGDWVDGRGRRSAHYNNILPGQYRFRVLACNNDGVWNEQGAMVSFVLFPHFWQTAWFKLLVVAGVGLLLALGYRIHTGRLREIERLRIRIAADLHDEVGSSLGTISLLSRLLHKQSERPEQKQDLATIQRISTDTANSVRDIVWFINPDYDTMQDLLLRMKDAANTMLGDIRCRFDLPTENLSRKLPLDFRQNIFLMFKESLANIVKHSRASCIEIKVCEENGFWKMTINDNGTGFDAGAASNGNGLKNLRRRAEKMNGSLEIKSAPGSGTSIIFEKRF
ncbi:MAG: Two component regulator propeller domain protein [Verrucomicrobiales bacterium]|nr:Two component regulator propeller domain protein [Verrucomicrobiales bacterium]